VLQLLTDHRQMNVDTCSQPVYTVDHIYTACLASLLMTLHAAAAAADDDDDVKMVLM